MFKKRPLFIAFGLTVLILGYFLFFNNPIKVKNAFFVAGHVYGNPMYYQKGLYPSFKRAIPFINNDKEITLGFLTGDVVPKDEKVYWDSFQEDIKSFKVPIHIAAGNHDRGPEFLKRFKRYYYSFKQNKDLYIILNPTKWHIEGKQKIFLFNLIKKEHNQVNHIFIFCHELIWWSPTNQFKNVKINYKPHYPGSSNFWTEIQPELIKYKNDFIFFAGDLGCVKAVDNKMYYKKDNITLIATGMGGGLEDNYIKVKILEDGSIQYEIWALNHKSPQFVGDLSDEILP